MTADDVRSLRRQYELLLVLRFVPNGCSPRSLLLFQRARPHPRRDRAGHGSAGRRDAVPRAAARRAGRRFQRKPILLLATGASVVASGLYLAADSVAVLRAWRPRSRGSSVPSTADRAGVINRRVAGRRLGRRRRAACRWSRRDLLLDRCRRPARRRTAGARRHRRLDPLKTPLAMGLFVQVLALVAIAR